MDRRSFLGKSAVLGISMKVVPGLAEAEFLDAGVPPAKAEILKALENRLLAVKVFADASTQITDKRSGVTWRMGPVALQDKSEIEVGEVWKREERGIPEQYPGRFVGKRKGEKLEFTLLARQNRPMGKFVCDIALEAEFLVYHVLEVEDTIPSLSFPPPIESEAVVVPNYLGQMIRKTESGSIFSRRLVPFFTRLNMRWIGGLRGDAGWIGIFDEGFEDSCALLANRHITPVWLRSLGKWRHGYTFRFTFTSGGYVGLAKTYRQWFKKTGNFVTLEQKMERNPRLKSFLGGRAFWINLARPGSNPRTEEELLIPAEKRQPPSSKRVEVYYKYAELFSLLDQLKKAGLRKGFLKIAGWINGGYDYSHQDIWPPEPELGSLEELRRLLALDGELVAGLHDNNQDMYEHTPSFPRGVNRLASGELMTGGIWWGGQAYILSSRASVEYARRNWEKIKTLHPPAMFIDIVTAMQLYQSFEEGHQMTKAEDLRFKTELLAFYKKQGVLLGSEEAADFGIPYIDWFENRHRRVAGESIPLWPLVFHDAAFCTRYGGMVQTGTCPGWLEDMLWGYLPHFRIGRDWKPGPVFTDTFHVDRWHESIGMAEMTNHRFLAEDWSVEECTFSNGRAILCNFSAEPRTVEGVAIPAWDYRLRD